MLSKRDVALNCALLLCALAVIGIDLGTTYSVRLLTPRVLLLLLMLLAQCVG